MADVTFSRADLPLMTDAQGTYRFTPGMMQRNWVIIPMPRAIGELAKDMGMGGCDHQLELEYLNVADGDVEDVTANLQDIWTPASGSPRSGTLTVPGFGPYPHCIVVTCEPGEPQRVVQGITPDDVEGVERWNLSFSVTFRQLRR